MDGVTLDFETVDEVHYFVLDATRARSGRVRDQVSGARYKNGRWTFPVDYAVLVHLITLYEDLVVSPAVANWLAMQKERRADRGQFPVIPETGDRLRDYQHELANWLAYEPTGLLAADVGTGKTRVALEVMFNSGNPYLPNLVVAPASVLHSWEEECAKVWPAKNVIVLSGSMSKAARSKVLLSEDWDLVIMSYHVLSGHVASVKYGAAKLSAREKEEGEINWLQFNTMVVDESHRLGSPTAATTRAVWGASLAADRRYALTATPVRNMSAELWGIFRFLNPGLWTSRTKFVEFFCDHYNDVFGFHKIRGLRQDRLAAFDAALGYSIKSVAADDVIDDLPEEMDHFRYLDLPPKLKKQYKQLETKQLITYIDADGAEDVRPLPEAGVRNSRLRALAQGATIRLNDQGEAMLNMDKSPKIPELLSTVQAIGDAQIVVYGDFIDVIGKATVALVDANYKVRLITGATSAEDRKAFIEAFQSGHVQVLLCSLRAVSEGVTLTAANHIIYLQMNYSAVDHRQSRGRIRRIGQKAETVHYHYIVMRDTVDEDQIESVEKKETYIQEVLA